jgi:hypothetical protein
MLPVLEFYANHTLDFKKTDIYELENAAITELRKIDIPGDILLIVLDSLRLQFPNSDLSAFVGINNWSPISFPEIRGVPEIPKQYIVSMGPMGLRIVIRPQHIILPSIIYEREDWYSPHNKEKIKIIRSYYHSVISLFGGDHAVYVDEKIINKYYPSKDDFDTSALPSFEQALITQYGSSKKTLFDYAHGKYPKYYIDNFSDIK